MDDESQQPDGPYLTVRAVAELFDVQTYTIREWLKNGTIRGIKIGKGHYWRIPQSEVTRLATHRYGDTR